MSPTWVPLDQPPFSYYVCVRFESSLQEEKDTNGVLTYSYSSSTQLYMTVTLFNPITQHQIYNSNLPQFLQEMDLQEWEILPHKGFLDTHEDEKKVNSEKTIDQLVSVPIQLNPSIKKGPDDDAVKEVTKFPIFETIVTGADQETVPKVFFNEFVDMKGESPKYNSEAMENMSSPRMNSDIKETKWEENGNGVNVWKWSLTGIGAVCSIGAAAAVTICIIIFGSHQRNKQQLQNQKIQFKIYAEEKRINQVVHQTSKLNEAISTVRGFPSRAQITIGGYLDAL